MSYCNFNHVSDVCVYEDHQLGLVVMVSKKAGGKSAGAMYTLETKEELMSCLNDLVKEGYKVRKSVLNEIADEIRKQI